ncbi:MAG: hypothetical protein AUI33_12560 [Ignavibacteria bacterium 13_1_40CM_2_61_4]|nr:MAG: hypothetical protein AUI33_12560 [Ignavibacteria bacterium 13_1_40CM_2_61_4]
MGSLWLGDEDLAAYADTVPVEVYWLLGAEAAERLRRIAGTAPLLGSTAFERGGIFVMRRSGRHLLIDAGPHGQQGLGGHAHNDILHIEVWADGVGWLVDGGVGVYAPDLRLRNRMRSTRAHNTLMIDNEEQWPFDPRRPFLLPASRWPRILGWRSDSTADWFDAESDAYSRLKSPVHHRRRVLFAKDLDGWVVADDLTGDGRHRVRWALHLGPGISATVSGPGRFQADHESGACISIACRGFPDGQFRIVDDIVSFSYGTTEPSLTLEWEGILTCPIGLRVTILPSASDQRFAEAERHTALLEAWIREASV